ncbi:MAG: DMT family transporter [Bacteroidales bacterium]|nr:DMT family transporter [Bacteroidales bacterium]
MSRSIKAHLSMLGVSVIFGLHYSIAKSMMPAYLTPWQMVFIRLLGAVILFWGFQRFFLHEKVERRDLLMLALCGLIGFTLNITLFYAGLNLTTPVNASIIHVTNPIMVLILASIIIREKVTIRKTGGILLGMSGALILILWGRHLQFGGQTAWGNILVLLNMMCYSLYLVLLKPLLVKYHTVTILKWVSFFGFLFVIPVSAKSMLDISFTGFDWYAWIALFYIIVITTFLVYLMINYSLNVLTPTAVSYYTYLQPILAAVSSVSVGMERITLPKVVAAVLIFVGVYLVTGKTWEKVGNTKYEKRIANSE